MSGNKGKKSLAIISIFILGLSVIAPVIKNENEKSLLATHSTPDITIRKVKATADEKEANRKMARDYAKAGFGWTGNEYDCLLALWTTESRFDHLAKNQRGSSAYGIAQRIGETSDDPALQILAGLRYINNRYLTPCKALRHHDQFGWY